MNPRGVLREFLEEMVAKQRKTISLLLTTLYHCTLKKILLREGQIINGHSEELEIRIWKSKNLRSFCMCRK